MIITATPFRISFAGGGSDIAVYYKKQKGAVLSATINKYIYISIHPYFNIKQTNLKYSKSELVNDIKHIKHPIFHEALKMLLPEGGVELVSTADIPSGSGLGSSSSFAVGLLNALYAYIGKFSSKEKLAEKACMIEIDKLKEPIGKQDQYAASFGGLNFIEFSPDDTVMVTPLILDSEKVKSFNNNLLLFYTGDQRNTADILKDQNEQLSSSSDKMQNLSKMVDIAYAMRDEILNGHFKAFGKLLHEEWLLKRSLSHKISNKNIDKYYERAIEYGAVGGKLLGAGSGGFMLLYCEPKHQEKIRKALFDLYELPFKFEWGGSRIIYVGQRHTKKGFVY
jgi:D-glycero-alpha-D-manno-heptose-7-phosphate kinase